MSIDTTDPEYYEFNVGLGQMLINMPPDTLVVVASATKLAMIVTSVDADKISDSLIKIAVGLGLNDLEESL